MRPTSVPHIPRLPGRASRSSRRRSATAIAAVVALGVLVACGGEGGGAGDGDGQALTVWTLENLPDRMQAQEKIAKQFSEDTGIRVKLVGVAEDQYSQLLTSAAASGDLPDLIGALPLAGVRELAVNDLANSEVAEAVIDDLGADTFSEQALALTADGDTQLSVPSDGWAQLLVYRKDLFDQAGLEPPETYDAIEAAAKELDSGEVAGFVGANIPNDAFTVQTFEHLALANGCEMVTDDREVVLDSPQCAEAFDFYGRLLQNYSVSGAQDVDTTRATYFAGEAAMVIWSSFILDELAGLRNDAKPSCPECKDDSAWLAENSGVVTALQGPSGTQPAQFGEVVSWAATIDADAEAAQKFVSYMMEEGYSDWIGFAPEGKIPTRQGTADEPTKFIDEWTGLPAGVDTKAPLSDFYDPETLEALKTAPDTIQRWAITQGAGELLGATLSELPVAQAANKVSTGEIDGQQAAQEADQDVTSIQESLE
jgi:multiple sugar transport system substrate-binding protein